jgi:uracil-DNA glycosylase
MTENLAVSWKNILKNEFEKPYFLELTNFIEKEYKSETCYPPYDLIFNAFNKCEFENIKVVIIGQDPYHGHNQANGLCFSVNDEVPFPPSLNNIFKEIKNDCGKEIPKAGNLEKWAEQGILLLNATLTVRLGLAGSHQKKGWETFTDAVIDKINKQKNNVVFMLWGNYAQKKGRFIDSRKHFVLKAKHPSPLSANFGGWFEQNQFSKANDFLKKHNQREINW